MSVERPEAPALDADEGIRAAYALHGRELFGFAIRALGDRGLAEEAVQETFLRAWRSAGRFDPAISSLRTWLFAIARNVMVDLARARASRPRLAGEAGPERAAEGDPIDRALVRWQVEEALRRLGEEHRRVLVETYFRGRPYGEVAALLRIPEGTVKSRVFYALKALRLALDEMGWAYD